MNIANHEIQPAEARIHRPWAITVLCVFQFLICAQLFMVILVYLMTKELTIHGQRSLLTLSMIFLLKFAGVVGYWKMLRWGIYLISLEFIISLLIAPFLGWGVSLNQIIFPLIMIATGIFYWKRMR